MSHEIGDFRFYRVNRDPQVLTLTVGACGTLIPMSVDVRAECPLISIALGLFELQAGCAISRGDLSTRAAARLYETRPFASGRLKQSFKYI